MWKRLGYLPLLAVLLLLGGAVVVTGGWWDRDTAVLAQRLPADHGRGRVVAGQMDPNQPYDLQFIDQMAMHHEGAIMSARMMIGNSPHPELRDLAQRIETVQQQQIDVMLAWRSKWYADASPASSGGMMGGRGMGGMMQGTTGMGGMMGGRSMMGGNSMMGDGDHMFLQMMIPHHQVAIDMSQDALQKAEHPELRDLAQQIIDGQSAEITEMGGYLKAWYGESSTRDLAPAMQDMMGR